MLLSHYYSTTQECTAAQQQKFKSLQVKLCSSNSSRPSYTKPWPVFLSRFQGNPRRFPRLEYSSFSRQLQANDHYSLLRAISWDLEYLRIAFGVNCRPMSLLNILWPHLPSLLSNDSHGRCWFEVWFPQIPFESFTMASVYLRGSVFCTRVLETAVFEGTFELIIWCFQLE